MRMKKENMDHIRERFENETGVKLPEKEGFEMPAWTGRIVAAAAGLICLVGLGFVWHKVSVDKQESAETLLADGEVDYGEEVAPEENEEAIEAETEEGDINPDDVLICDSDVRSSENNSINREFNDDDDTLSISGEVYGKAFETSVYTRRCDGIQLFLIKNPKDVPDGTTVNVDDIMEPLIYPVPSDIDRFYIATDDSDAKTCNISIFGDNYQLPKDGYYCIGANVGEDVLAMHDCIVTDCGFDTEKGNYITTRFDDITIEYRHLDQVFISAGDKLNSGDKIATAGNSGMSTGPHLGIVATADDGSIIGLIAIADLGEEVDITPPADFYEEEPIED